MTPADTPAPMTDYRLEEISSEYKDYDQNVRLCRIGGTLLFGEFASMISELLRHRSSPSTAGGGLPEEPTDDMATSGARCLGDTMHAPNQHGRAIQVWRQMVATFKTGALHPVPVNAAQPLPEPPK